MKKALIFTVMVAIAGASGFFLQRYLTDTASTSPSIANNIRPVFAMADLQRSHRNIKEWDGKIILLNFWATWCAPCLKEIPDLIELQTLYGQQGMQIIGIAVDKEAEVREFVAKMGINYPVLVSEKAGELSSAYGNTIDGLPFTAVINREGRIIETITGTLDPQRAENILSRLGINI